MRSMVLNHHAARPLLVALTVAAALAVFPAAAYADTGRPAPVTGGLPLTNTTEKIGPGIDLQHVQALDQNGWYNARFLNVNLSDKAVSTDLLTAGPVASGGPLSEAADKAGAVAGVNGDFYDLGNSTAAHGAEIQNGKLLKTSCEPPVHSSPTRPVAPCPRHLSGTIDAGRLPVQQPILSKAFSA
jgi:hypothetical protein